MTGTEYVGYWNTDAPLSKEEAEADVPILQQLIIPEGVTVKRLEAYVHGRLYEWHTLKLNSVSGEVGGHL